jgi:hypothetical protein
MPFDEAVQNVASCNNKGQKGSIIIEEMMAAAACFENSQPHLGLGHGLKKAVDIHEHGPQLAVWLKETSRSNLTLAEILERNKSERGASTYTCIGACDEFVAFTIRSKV